MQNLKSALTIELSGYGSNCEPSCALSCPNNWDRGGDHCYYLSETRMKWLNAEDHCRKIGGHLASITNERIHNFMKNKLNNEHGGDNKVRWIGGRRKPGTNTFVWTDCRSWGYNQGWGNGRPDDNQDCVLYNFERNDQFWDDAACTNAYKFVCSKPICSGKL